MCGCLCLACMDIYLCVSVCACVGGGEDYLRVCGCVCMCARVSVCACVCANDTHADLTASRSKEEFVKIMFELNLPRPGRMDEVLPKNLHCGF